MRIGSFRGAALLAVAAATFLAAPRALRADPVLYVDDDNGVLGKVDVATGGVTVIGNTGHVLTDIAFDPSGALWGLDFTNLYRINAATGAATLVGAHGVTGGNALVFGSDGTLYAAGNATTNLYKLNTTTGAGTNLGSTGFTASGDLAFNGGKLYLSTPSFAFGDDYLVSINLAVSTFGTIVGPIGYQQVYGLATASNGTLYGVSGTQVISINTTTGAGSFVSNYAGHGLDAAFGTGFVTEAGAVVPLPTSAVMGLAVLGLTAAGGVARRYRAQPALLTA